MWPFMREELGDEGMEHINLGEHAEALASFEASLRCHADSYVLQLAFMESCASGNSAKAKLYYKKLTPSSRPSSRRSASARSRPSSSSERTRILTSTTSVVP